jgi:hypothetical protein
MGMKGSVRSGGMLLAGTLVAALAAACATAAPRAPAQGSGDGLLTLAPGQTSSVQMAAIGIGPMRVRFDGVENDSRCPADVACIHAGDAVVGISVTAVAGTRATYELHTTGATSVVHDGLTISVEGLDPRPVGSRPIRPADYRLTLRVRR